VFLADPGIEHVAAHRPGKANGVTIPTLPRRCHGPAYCAPLNGTRRNGPGIVTSENDCKTAPHLCFVVFVLANSIPVPPTKFQ
jgi:hypothetical protein